MREIQFENDKTPVSQTTFLAFQKNIKDAIEGKTLYENWVGSANDVDLQEDYNQFSKIRIYAGKGEVGITMIEIPKELYNQKINIVQAQWVERLQTMQLIEKQFFLQGTFLKVFSKPAYINFKGAQIVEQGLENSILVYKVIGFE